MGVFRLVLNRISVGLFFLHPAAEIIVCYSGEDERNPVFGIADGVTWQIL